MHWLLSTTEAFSLREVIRRCGRRYPPAVRALASGRQLCRVEALDRGTVVELTVEQVPAGLVLRTDSRLSGQETEDASRRIWRMLRLEEDLAPFLRLAERTEALASVKHRGARLLRGTTLFEDVVMSITTTWDIDGSPDYGAATSLVNRLGPSLPSNPTLHGFPAAERILAEKPYLIATLGDGCADQIVATATAFQSRGRQIEALLRRPMASAELGGQLSLLLRLEPDALSQLMVRLGRYDYVPTDALARSRLERYVGAPGALPGAAVEAFFGRWHPWGGLAYWLWDWNKVAEPHAVATA